MNFLQNRKIAWVVLAMSVLTSVVGMGGGSLAAQRSEAVRIFNDGIDDSFAVRFSMDAYLENCAEYARTMAEEYRLRASGNNDVAAEILDLALIIGDGEDFDNRYSAYKLLCAKVESLYTDFFAEDVSKSDAELFSKAYSNFQGEVSKLAYDEYHVLAQKFNRERDGFPANAIAALLRIEPLNPF